jgi:subtilisin family serine protease
MAALLAGCGGGDGGDSATAAPAATTPPVITPIMPPVTPPVTTPVTQSIDPLFPYQWHLQNTGQDTLSSIRPTAGIDLNLDSLHAAGVRGAGVRVAVIDSGLDIEHEDLKANVVAGGSINFVSGSSDPTPSDTGPDHGTAVAGIVAARGWNGVGGRGVAPESTLQGFNLIAAQNVANYLASLGAAPQSANVDVFNLSIGEDVTDLEPLSRNDIDTVETLFGVTRSGRGGLYIKASGNGFSRMEKIDCSAAQQRGVSCDNAAFDWTNNLAGVTTVGAVNAAGVRASYSTPGASLWIAGLGGEYGRHRDQAPGLIDIAYQPAILTTDLSGCDKGYHRNADPAINALDVATSSLDPLCRYTNGFNGTSAATPSVAGVVAMMLQINPALTQREVEYLLATTARRIDYPGTPVHHEGLAIDDAWVLNAANRAFSNAYGFGLVDARAAVDAALTAKRLAPAQRTNWLASQSSAPEPIPYRDGANGRGQIPISVSENLSVEHVQVAFSTTHRDPGKLRVTLISPSGTRSILLWPFSSLKPLTDTTTAGFSADLMRSNAFLDEKSQGTWRLEVIDVSAPSGTSTAQFTNWSLRIAGR